MSEEAERIYTINLGKVLLSPNNIRAKRAINMIREFGRHHMKIEDIRLDEEVSEHVWRRGIKHPPRKIRVRMEKTDEGHVMVHLYDEGETAAEEPEEKTSEAEPATAPAAALPSTDDSEDEDDDEDEDEETDDNAEEPKSEKPDTAEKP